MSKISLAFFFFIFVNIGWAQSLTLDDCANLAKENNLALQQSKMNIEQARSALTEANASFYPSLNLSSNYRTSGDFEDQISDSYSTGLSTQYTLYKGNSIRAGAKIAQTRVQIAEESFRQKQAEVVLAVQQAFYKILQIEEQMTLINDVLKRRQENLTLLRLNYSVGRENQTNVEQAEVNVSQTEYDLLRAEQNLALAKLKLSQLIGLALDDILITYQDKPVEFPLLDTLTLIAKNERPEVIIEKANRVILESQVSQAKSSYLPSVSVSSSYGLQGDQFLQQSSSWSAGIGLSLPLFNGFSTRARVNQSQVSVKQNILKFEDLLQSIETEIKQAYIDWQMAQKNLEVSQKNLQATRNAYQLTKLQYEQGRTSYFFVQQKESELSNAENGYVNAMFNLRSSVVSLEKTIGRSN
ncbi:MAG: TolC family protein [Candidatus Latescibacteria bacterium]|nr:TolC family protein [Candidatus Latescibacterota bacterium]